MLGEGHQCSLLFSAQKEQAMQPLSCDLWALELPGALPAGLLPAYISTRQGRKNPFSVGYGGLAGSQHRSGPGWESYGHFERRKLSQRAVRGRTWLL